MSAASQCVTGCWCTYSIRSLSKPDGDNPILCRATTTTLVSEDSVRMFLQRAFKLSELMSTTRGCDKKGPIQWRVSLIFNTEFMRLEREAASNVLV